jgi:four helix bundle protein
MRKFNDLIIWKDGRALTKNVYQLTTGLPASERFGLTTQIKRCVISIPANIAEGSAKRSQRDFARFLQISLGSCFELESHLILCNDLDLLTIESTKEIFIDIEKLQKRITRMLIYTDTQTSNPRPHTLHP